ncbi:hypothetical protein N7449_007575 [Penicillium cf. viridicatum]|uniref:Uncharacterized protein n=1 Tax=Penicillium cf. viridicatum TaxID=2972119 RepID=A0A9W9MBM1_9EURO|nr:hypothetical protein N7449_007575 [Penicillium cf. viridicatum]
MCTKTVTRTDNDHGTGSRYGLTSESNTFFWCTIKGSYIDSGPVYHRSFFPFSPAPNSKYVRARTSHSYNSLPRDFSKTPIF